MNDVVWTLEFELEKQESAAEGIKTDGAREEFEDEKALLFNDWIELIKNNGGQVLNSGMTMTSNSGMRSI